MMHGTTNIKIKKFQSHSEIFWEEKNYWGPQVAKKAINRHIINDVSSPLSVFLLYFAEIIRLLLMKITRYCHGHLDN
jgi:hypothetical protein